jgi:hypothetical protein
MGVPIPSNHESADAYTYNYGITSSHVQAMQSQLVMVDTTPRAGFSLSTPERVRWAHVTAIPTHLQGAAVYVAVPPLSSKRPQS